MVIYGTELALWLGIFACGGIFNFIPWVKKRTKTDEREVEPELEPEPVSIHRMPSSTSVFRTVSGSETVTRRRQQ